MKGNQKMIYTVTLNPAIDKTVEIDGLTLGNVNRISALRADAGGKGINVSKVVATLSGQSVAHGIIGGSGGQMIKNTLEQMGIKTDFVEVDAETRVNMKIIDTKNRCNTDINEPGSPVTADVIKAVEKKLADSLKPGDIAVLAGSVPKGAAADIYGRLVRLCNACEARAVLDVDGALMAPGLAAKPYLIKPNIDELSRLCGTPLKTVKDCIAPIKKLLADGKSENYFVAFSMSVQIRKTYALLGLFQKNAAEYVAWYEEKNAEDIPADVKAVAEERWAARTNKDWAKSDKLRAKLAEMGYAVKDSKTGYELTKN